MKTPDQIQYDRATQEWFDRHPDALTTIRRCEKCGLYYKTGIGHKCETNSVIVKENRNRRMCDEQQRR